MSTPGVQPAQITVRRWGEGAVERVLPGAPRVLVNGESAGGAERTAESWRACWFTAQYRDKMTHHDSAEEAVRAVISSGWARHLGARRASSVAWTRAARRLARGSAR